MWNGSREAQRQADAAWNAVKHLKRKKSPRRPTFIPYRTYIASKAWRKKRQAALRHHGRVCAICQKTTGEMHVHHLTYERLGQEKMRDLQVLCVDCHVTHHDIPTDSLSVEFRDVIG